MGRSFGDPVGCLYCECGVFLSASPHASGPQYLVQAQGQPVWLRKECQKCRVLGINGGNCIRTCILKCLLLSVILTSITRQFFVFVFLSWGEDIYVTDSSGIFDSRILFKDESYTAEHVSASYFFFFLFLFFGKDCPKKRAFLRGGGIYLNYNRVHVCFLFLLFLIFGVSLEEGFFFWGGWVFYLNECIQCAPVLKYF